jgi:hypothetical protein
MFDVNHRNNFGLTALIRTACRDSVERDDINVNVRSDWRTALYYAYYEGSFGVMDLLLDRDDIDINVDSYLLR